MIWPGSWGRIMKGGTGVWGVDFVSKSCREIGWQRVEVDGNKDYKWTDGMLGENGTWGVKMLLLVCGLEGGDMNMILGEGSLV